MQLCWYPDLRLPEMAVIKFVVFLKKKKNLFENPMYVVLGMGPGNTLSISFYLYERF